MSGYMGEEEVIKMNEALAEKLTYTVEELESMPEGIRGWADWRENFLSGNTVEAASGVTVIYSGNDMELYQGSRGKLSYLSGAFCVPLFTASKDKSEVKAVGRRLPLLRFTAW